MSLRPYQDEGVEFLRARDRAILADEPGLGKSAQAIVAAEQRNFTHILVVCPAIGRVSWPIELAKWDISERRIVIAGKDAVGGNSPSVHLVSYDLISRGGPIVVHLVDLAQKGYFDLLVIDEGQYLKETSAKRTKTVYRELVPRIKNTWVLSGTITPNHNGELYPHIAGLFPAMLAELLPGTPRRATREQFEDTFCKVTVTQYGRQIVGNHNTVVLREALKPYLLRRKATDVVSEMPALTVEHLEFDEGPMLSPLQAQAVREAVKAFDAVGAEHLDLAMATERRTLGLAKVPLAAAWAIDQLDSGQDKIILFAHHQDVVSSLAAALLDYNPVAITGSTDTGARVTRVKSFQTDPAVRVLVGNIQAAGTSITLTASNRVGIVEPSWVPGENAQAIRRSYRLGQKRPVIATFISVKGSLDATINATLVRKANDIAVLLDDEQAAQVRSAQARNQELGNAYQD